MSEQESAAKVMQKKSAGVSDNTVSIVAIIAVSIIMLACIASCTLIAYAFFSNPPWGF